MYDNRDSFVQHIFRHRYRCSQSPLARVAHLLFGIYFRPGIGLNDDGATAGCSDKLDDVTSSDDHLDDNNGSDNDSADDGGGCGNDDGYDHYGLG